MSTEVANPIISLPPQPEQGAPQSPSNPIETIDIEQENDEILPDHKDSPDNISHAHTEYETKQPSAQDSVPDTEPDQMDGQDTQDDSNPPNQALQTEDTDMTANTDDTDDTHNSLSIPSHHRVNDVSTHTIETVIQSIDKDSSHKPEINEEKVNIIQKRVLKMEYGHCSKQGIRPSMEDCVVVEPSFTVYGSKCTSNNLSIYAVFDGHGGKQCAQYCSSNLCDIFTKYLQTETSVDSAFKQCISELDQKAIDFSKDASGSTCCIILFDNIRFDLYCCNVGDSRCILVNHNQTNVRQLSIEHKPDYPIEKQRIEQANGWVTFGRVCGILAVSRSLGDKDFKYEIENLIISTPDVTHNKLVFGEDKYIVLACDGLYDVFTNEQCMEWIRSETSENECDMQDITDKLCNDAIYVRKSKDNVSVLVLRVGIDMIEMTERENTDFEGTELAIEEDDEVKDCDKVYNSTSSNGSVGSPNNDSLQSQMSNLSMSDETKQLKVKPSKFHVVMESDDTIDALTQQISDGDANINNDESK